jgi:hypothetical protein
MVPVRSWSIEQSFGAHSNLDMFPLFPYLKWLSVPALEPRLRVEMVKQHPALWSLQFPAHVTSPVFALSFLFLQVTNQSQIWSGCCTIQAFGTLPRFRLFAKSDI